MTDGIVNIRGKEYKTVALRVAEFRSKHPIAEGWGIVTEATGLNEVIKVKACVISPRRQGGRHRARRGAPGQQ